MEEQTKSSEAMEQNHSQPRNNDAVQDTIAIADRDEGNTNNGELGGNFATYDQPVKPAENESK